MDCHTEKLRELIAERLRIDPDRIKLERLPGDGVGRFGTTGEHWQIHYRGEWRELPWHFDGPTCVTREMVRRWHGAGERSD